MSRTAALVISDCVLPGGKRPGIAQRGFDSTRASLCSSTSHLSIVRSSLTGSKLLNELTRASLFSSTSHLSIVRSSLTGKKPLSELTRASLFSSTSHLSIVRSSLTSRKLLNELTRASICSGIVLLGISCSLLTRWCPIACFLQLKQCCFSSKELIGASLGSHGSSLSASCLYNRLHESSYGVQRKTFEMQRLVKKAYLVRKSSLESPDPGQLRLLSCRNSFI